ncbi:MAG: transporter, partial [Lysobacterales bacterium]
VDGKAYTGPLGARSSGTSGLGDPYLALRVGLVGAPALEPADFMKTPPGFQLYALAGVSLPWGEYNQNTPLNLGTNRWALRLGLPMVMPLGKKPGSTWLEIHPNVYIYGDNNKPFRADTRSQDALYVLESHLTHNFTKKFWAGIDLRYQNGGETTTDGVNDDNKVNRLGGGISIGYTFSRAWNGFISYGEVISESDNSKLNMWRARLIWVF